MRTSSRTFLVAAAASLGLLVVLAAAAALPSAPYRAAGVLLAELVHLACALVAGASLLKIVRASPRTTLELVVFGCASGLALLSLFTLLLSALGLTHALSSWIADLLALLVGFGQIRSVLGSLRDAWIRLDLSFVMASRIPLLAALAIVSLIHLAPPFLPSGPDTGAVEHALSAQADVRGSLRGALAARPGSSATPADGLLLHGRLAAGEAGARLHVAVLAALLTAGAFMHARRRLGGRTAAWVGLCLASSPALLLLDAASPTGTWIALHGFLFFAELSDWSARPAPGKVTVAFLHGGLLLAQSQAGVTAFFAVLVFLVLVEALVERHAPLRLVGGLVGLVWIALLVALPFLLADSGVRRVSPLQLLPERYGGAATVEDGGWASAGLGLLDPDAGVDAPLRRLAALGPLVLCLLLLTPLAPEDPEGLRHAVIMFLLALGAWALPPPWGTGALVLPAAALCAGATARAFLAVGGTIARLAAAIVTLSIPVTLLAALNAGPDLFAGAGIMTGGTSRAQALERFVPDHALVTTSSLLAPSRKDLVLLVGELTDAQYGSPVLRWPDALTLRDASQFGQAVRGAGITHVAVDHSFADGPPRETYAELERVDGFADGSRYAFYRVSLTPPPVPQDEEELPLGAPPDDLADEEEQAPTEAPSR